MKVENLQVYGLENSFRVSKFPMLAKTEKANTDITDRIKKLSSAPKGSGHDNFLKGIVVQFDLTFSNKAWVEAERYHFFDFVSSQSTMHCISKMDIRDCCNEYVTLETINEVERLKSNYLADPTAENYLRLLYNVPSGFQLTAGMTTNYQQLKTIYSQRKDHRLPEWRNFCKWLKDNLPYSFLVTGEEN